MEMGLDLDRSSPVPLYRQLAAQMESAIRGGALTPGTELGNEARLAESLGVSRPTVRQAILALVEKGLLVRRRGIGTHVVDAPVVQPLTLTSLFDDLTAKNQLPTTRVLVQETVPAPEEVAAALGVPVEQPVIHLLRLRYTDNTPLVLMENYIPAQIVDLEGINLATTGLYQALRANGVFLKVARQRIGARAGTDEESQVLGQPPHSPMLIIERVTHDSSGRIVEYGVHLYRADRYQYAVTLVDRPS